MVQAEVDSYDIVEEVAGMTEPLYAMRQDAMNAKTWWRMQLDRIVAKKQQGGGFLLVGPFSIEVMTISKQRAAVLARQLRELQARAVAAAAAADSADSGTDATLEVSVRRAHLVHDSFVALRGLGPHEARRKLRVSFDGEDGIDSGGLSKDWFLLLSRAFFTPGLVLFKAAGGSGDDSVASGE